jgi:hypothetical protein
MTDDRADIYAAMGDEDDDAADAAMMAKPLISGGTLNLHGGKSVPVIVGDKSIDAATLAYVQRLEKIVQEQGLAIKKQERLLRSFAQMTRHNRTLAANTHNRLTEVSHELDSKIDRRD